MYNVTMLIDAINTRKFSREFDNTIVSFFGPYVQRIQERRENLLKVVKLFTSDLNYPPGVRELNDGITVRGYPTFIENNDKPLTLGLFHNDDEDSLKENWPKRTINGEPYSVDGHITIVDYNTGNYVTLAKAAGGNTVVYIINHDRGKNSTTVQPYENFSPAFEEFKQFVCNNLDIH